jgi:hypothetical protein
MPHRELEVVPNVFYLKFLFVTYNPSRRRERRKIIPKIVEKRDKKNNPKNSGHFVPQQRLRAAHALRSDHL